MRTVPALVLAMLATAVLSLTLRATPAIGASLDAVLAEKGQPVGRTGAGSTLILAYPDETIVLKDGHVKEVRQSSETTTVPDRKVTEAERRRVAADRNAGAAAAVSALSWSTDYDSALSTARGGSRKVFLFFTGSDWCGWCMKLNREILNTPEFAAYASNNLLLVELDFPRGKPQPAEERSRNEKLAGKYGVRGFPTVVVLDSRGKVLGSLGYQDGGPGPFIEALKKL